MKIITGATLVLPHGQQGEASMLIDGNRIRAITTDPPASLLLNQENVEVISGEGCYLTPGLIELHFNGALGCNLNHTSIGEVQALLQKLPAYGVTSAMLTVITGPLTDMLSAIQTLEEVIHHKMPGQCRPLGLHLEGPYISHIFKGAHPIHDVRPLDMTELQLLLSPTLKMMTLAPELDPEGQAIRMLSEKGIRVSIGHSGATLEEATRAVDAGAISVTHLYNAMRPFHQREPGIMSAALTDDRLYAQVIGDGVHVHPAAIKMLLRCKRPEQILLTSDASPAAGMPEGTTVNFAGQETVVQKQQNINRDGVLSGSSSLITDCVRNLTRWNLTGFADAIQFTTLNPAVFLNEPQLGRLEPGCFADVVLWDKNTLEVQTTLINGQTAYQRNATQQYA